MISRHGLQYAGALALGLALLSGCQSKQDAAVDQAKKQAAATGQAQQVVSIDKNGTTTTTTVQPPVPGQAGQTVTTTVRSGPGTAPAVGPAVAPTVGQPATAQGTPAYAPGTVGAQQGVAPQTAPVPGGAPVIRAADVSIPAGTDLAIRVNQHISVKSSRVGERFDGEVVEPILNTNGGVLVPKGTPVAGVIDASHRRGHFKGASVLELRLTSMTLNGTRYPLETRDLARRKKGKGKRSAAFIGGGTGLGALIGGVAGGGVGLVVGGLAGAGAGTAVAGLTGNRDLEIPAESIMHFRLADDLVVAQ